MCAEIPCRVIAAAVCLSQYLKMRFGRGMQLLGSIQFLVATVRQTSLCYSVTLHSRRQSCIRCSQRRCHIFATFLVQIFALAQTRTQFAKLTPGKQFFDLLKSSMTSKTSWSRLFPFSQLLYTGIVIYAPALILNQGRRNHLMPLCLYALMRCFHSCFVYNTHGSLIFGPSHTMNLQLYHCVQVCF